MENGKINLTILTCVIPYIFLLFLYVNEALAMVEILAMGTNIQVKSIILRYCIQQNFYRPQFTVQIMLKVTKQSYYMTVWLVNYTQQSKCQKLHEMHIVDIGQTVLFLISVFVRNKQIMVLYRFIHKVIFLDARKQHATNVLSTFDNEKHIVKNLKYPEHSLSQPSQVIYDG